jgi:deoxyribonuclease-4
MWKSSPPSQEKIADVKAAIRDTGITHLISHDTYLVNLCHAEPEVAEKSETTLRDEMVRCSAYDIPFVVSHIGALGQQERDVAFAKASSAILGILADTPDNVTLLMETTAGQGSAINSTFEDLAELLDRCKGDKRLAICVDTCHIFVAGYDIRTKETYEKTMADFDRVVGLGRLAAVHLNDTKKGLGSKVDRHDNIGKGKIGAEPFGLWMNDPRLESVPMVLETPIEDEGHEKDIAALRALMR